MTPDEIRSFLAEGFHTAFRKASDSSEGDAIWKLIHKMDNREWGAIIDFVANPLIDELRSSGFKKKELA